MQNISRLMSSKSGKKMACWLAFLEKKVKLKLMTALTDEARMHVYASKSKRMAPINHIQKVGYAGRKEIREQESFVSF